MAHEVEEMLSASNTPAWHGLGTVIEQAATADDVMRLVPELGTPVVAEPVFYRSRTTGKLVEIHDHRANVRLPVLDENGVKDDERLLGVVSDEYELSQTRDQFAVLDEIAGTELRYETAGSLRSGKIHWLLARLPESVKLVDDEVIPYMLMSNSFDGSRALTWAITPVRVVCANTLSWSDHHHQTRKFKVTHREGASERILDARRALGITTEYLEALTRFADAAARTTLSEQQIRKVINHAIPLPTIGDDGSNKLARQKAAEQRATVFVLQRELPDLDNFRNTAWGTYNALIEWSDHHSANSGAERKMQRVAMETSPVLTRAESAIRELVTL